MYNLALLFVLSAYNVICCLFHVFLFEFSFVRHTFANAGFCGSLYLVYLVLFFCFQPFCKHDTEFFPLTLIEHLSLISELKVFTFMAVIIILGLLSFISLRFSNHFAFLLDSFPFPWIGGLHMHCVLLGQGILPIGFLNLLAYISSLQDTAFEILQDIPSPLSSYSLPNHPPTLRLCIVQRFSHDLLWV